MHMQTHTQLPSQSHFLKNTHTRSHTHTHTQLETHAYTHILLNCTHTDLYTHNKCGHTLEHRLKCIATHLHTNSNYSTIRTNAYIWAHTARHTHRYTYTYPYRWTKGHTHTYTNTGILKEIFNHTHKLTYVKSHSLSHYFSLAIVPHTFISCLCTSSIPFSN